LFPDVSKESTAFIFKDLLSRSKNSSRTPWPLKWDAVGSFGTSGINNSDTQPHKPKALSHQFMEGMHKFLKNARATSKF
jgi:hypothetical protein